MHASAIAVLEEPETILPSDESTQFVENPLDVNDLVASRAFEIFEDRGRVFGHDLADWLQAEAEFLHPLHIEISESPETLNVRADVPGFTDKDLHINVEPRRITISGKREAKNESKTGKIIYSETCSDQILRVVDLPVAVVVKKATSRVKDGVLELDLPKAEPIKHDKAGPQAA
jgi:HSP20 family molecular chaperone IbpA